MKRKLSELGLAALGMMTIILLDGLIVLAIWDWHFKSFHPVPPYTTACVIGMLPNWLTYSSTMKRESKTVLEIFIDNISISLTMLVVAWLFHVL